MAVTDLGQVFFVHEHSTNPPPKTNMIWIRPIDVILGTYDFYRWNGTTWILFEPTVGGVFRGVWNNLVTYKRYDIVRYGQTLYSAKQDNLNKQPDSNLVEWELVLAAGVTPSFTYFEVAIASQTNVMITHNLGRLPIGIMVYDNLGNVFNCSKQATNSTLTLEFSQPFTGTVLFI